MKTHAFRLTYGQDLKDEIVKYCRLHNICAGYVASSVGCLYETRIRMAGGKSYFHDENAYEIVSLNGTLSKDGVHLHIAISDTSGKMIGGHLMSGCLVNTTCEVILVELDEFKFSREFDSSTGYDELTIEQISRD